VEVESCGVAIRSRTGPDLGLWVACEVRSDTDHADGHVLVADSPSGPGRSSSGRAQVTLDERWRVAHVDVDSDVLLGRPLAELVARSIIELTHPDDLAALLLAFARAGDERSAHVRVRLLHRDGSWRMVDAVPTMFELDGTSRFALTVAADEPVDSSGSSRRSTGLAEDLRRIADQIEASGVLAPLAETADVLGVAAPTALSPRQWEVVSRLVRGERVATMAAEMYLSKSTVRNHLSAIFQKVGVHSQQELLALWRTESRSRPSTER
jgi:DNA-binding CsgD family transcriptional regulator